MSTSEIPYNLVALEYFHLRKGISDLCLRVKGPKITFEELTQPVTTSAHIKALANLPPPKAERPQEQRYWGASCFVCPSTVGI